MRLTSAISLLTALPFALAAPTCSIRPAKSSASSAPSPTPTSVTTPANPSTGAGASGKIAMAWFGDWHSNYTVTNITWSHYTHMAFFTAEVSPSGLIDVSGLSDPNMPDEFTAAAKANNVKPILTVGGWDGSRYWSSSVATAQSRSTLANSLVQYANAHGFVGLDFDWEYPNGNGLTCNTKDPNDSANFLSFMQEVRQVAPNLTLSAATSINPWNDATDHPLTNVSAYAQVLDWIEIMNYDVFGSFSKVTGPNAPLDDSCAPVQAGSAKAGVAAWTAAGFPADKIVLGVPGYSHSFNVPQATAVNGNTLNLYTPFDQYNIPAGDKWDPSTTAPDPCGNPPPGNGNSGIWNFFALIESGFLNQDGTVASDMIGMFDTCSQTPFLYDPKQTMLVSYDDAQSFTAKGSYIKSAGLGGFAMYEAGSDYNNILVNAITQAMS